MILPTAFLALAITSAQAKFQAGQLFPPKPEVAAAPVDFANWHGWAYIGGKQSVWPPIYETSGDWSNIQARYNNERPPQSSIWHLKVVVFTRTESDGRDVNGVLREHRATIESVQMAQVTQALQRFVAFVSIVFNGAVRLAPEIEVESEWMRDSGPHAFGSDFDRRYLEARINGGSYEAEDKVFRGPFHSVLVILPGTLPEPVPDCVVNDTPVATVPASPILPNGSSPTMDGALRAAWYRQLVFRTKQQGFRGLSFSSTGTQSADPWPVLTNLDEVPSQTYLARVSTDLELQQALPDPADVKTPIASVTEAKIVADNERGQVLKVTEVSGIREGGVSLPARADGMPVAVIESTPTLTFGVKSASKNPTAIRLESSTGKTAWVSVGPDPTLVTPMAGAAVLSAPFIPSGKWQKVSVDLRPLAKQAGLSDVVRLAIEPSPNAKMAGKMQPEPVEFEFDEFKFSTDPAGPEAAPIVPNATSDNPEERALFAAQAKSASPALALLLKDRSELVRLNATSAYIALKDPSVEQQLIANSLDLDPSVSVAALNALMADGSDVAKSIVERSVSVSLSDYAKMMAGKLLADTKDPKMADTVSRLLANRSWQAHVMAVEALAEIPTPESQIWRLAFIGMSDPAVKLAVTSNADPTNEQVLPKLLWSAVNEPSDMVRVQSYIKLIQAPAPASRSEGYKGVRDDSKFVRRLVVQYLATHPSEDHRNALRTAIADRSAEVRAAALAGFAALDKGASTDEIANVLDDSNSDVQLALIDLSKKKALKLPQKTIDAMLASPDARVSAAAKGLT